jgi:hypothetical protein
MADQTHNVCLAVVHCLHHVIELRYTQLDHVRGAISSDLLEEEEMLLQDLVVLFDDRRLLRQQASGHLGYAGLLSFHCDAAIDGRRREAAP